MPAAMAIRADEETEKNNNNKHRTSQRQRRRRGTSGRQAWQARRETLTFLQATSPRERATQSETRFPRTHQDTRRVQYDRLCFAPQQLALMFETREGFGTPFLGRAGGRLTFNQRLPLGIDALVQARANQMRARGIALARRRFVGEHL